MDSLDRLTLPDDLWNMTTEQLNAVCADVRSRIIDTVSRRGGHLAPSLGAVELAVALHTAFRSPADKLIWDVGHQSYAHKLLTGRADRFHTLREYGGLSGFPRRKESDHDPFGTGHASTSISAALGLARGRDLRGERHRVVAVIGDGALTGGLAFEGLNNAGTSGTDLIVVLNDNSMSISRNVGALATYLGRMRSDPTYSRVKTDFERALRRVPIIGEPVRQAVAKLKDSVKYLMVPGMLFEELGFTYLGPIDGHNIPALLSILKNASQVRGPVLVHAITTKGRGYVPAEVRPDRFHGTGPFDPDTGTAIGDQSNPSYSQLFGRAMLELAERDPSVVAITAAMPDGTGLGAFAQAYPGRFFDVGIAEGHAVTFAAGLAAAGYKPVVAIYSTFLQRAFDNIVHDVCLQGLPVVFALDRAGIVGEDGATHHGLIDQSFLRCIPGLTVGAPSSGTELRDMLETAVTLGGPVALRYPRSGSPAWTGPPRMLVPPHGELLGVGDDVALLACGSMVEVAVKARELLAGHQVSAAAANLRWVKPLDRELVRGLAVRCRLIITLEENTVRGGMGSAVLEELADADCLVSRVVCLGARDRILEHGPRPYLLSSLGLSPERVCQQVLDMLRSDALRTTAHV